MVAGDTTTAWTNVWEMDGDLKNEIPSRCGLELETDAGSESSLGTALNTASNTKIQLGFVSCVVRQVEAECAISSIMTKTQSKPCFTWLQISH